MSVLFHITVNIVPVFREHAHQHKLYILVLYEKEIVYVYESNLFNEQDVYTIYLLASSWMLPVRANSSTYMHMIKLLPEQERLLCVKAVKSLIWYVSQVLKRDWCRSATWHAELLCQGTHYFSAKCWFIN